MNWIQVAECPICKSKDSKFYGQGYAPYISSPQILGGVPLAVVSNYAQCQDCNLIYQTPRLDNASLDELYRSGQYRKMLNSRQEDLDEDEIKRQKRIAPLITSAGRHLDIGCSRGYLLDISQRLGRSVLGVEPNLSYVMEGIDAVRTIEEVIGQWYTITALHILEHIPDPVDYAQKIMALLMPKGKLILEVPSEKSKGGPLRLWHLFLFMPGVIERLFADLTLIKFEETPHYLFVFEKLE